jgi:hypothetical protein
MALDLELSPAGSGPGSSSGSSGSGAGSRMRIAIELGAPLDIEYMREQDMFYLMLQFDRNPSHTSSGSKTLEQKGSSSSASSAASAASGSTTAGAGGSPTLYLPLAFYWPQQHLGLWHVVSSRKVPKHKVPIRLPKPSPATSSASASASAGSVSVVTATATVDDDSAPLVASLRHLATLSFEDLQTLIGSLGQL